MKRILTLTSIVLLVSCADDTQPTVNDDPAQVNSPPSADNLPQTLELTESGVPAAEIYAANCVACHGNIPSKQGVLGPPTSGASIALLREVMLQTEDEPTKSAWSTNAMITFPQLEDEIPKLAEFLNE